MVELVETALCTGCGGCYAVCPVACISMQRDSAGFVRPAIEEEKCIHCGKCGDVCKSLFSTKKADAPKAFAAAVKSDDLIMQTSSGGVFAALAESVISKGGVVCGAAFDKKMKLHHIIVDEKQELPPLYGSKYVQSRSGDAIKTLISLPKDIKILFAGTGCQVNAAKLLLQDHEQAVFVDIVCHGCPSPALFELHKSELEKKYDAPLKKINFRDKSKGWQSYRFTAEFKNGKKYSAYPGEDPYMRLFLKNMSLQNACHRCPAKCNSLSDITLGDFWGIKNVLPGFDYKYGASLVLLRTAAGRTAFEEIESLLNVSLADYDSALKPNPNVALSTPRPEKKDEFFSEIKLLSLNELAKKYTGSASFQEKIITRLKSR